MQENQDERYHIADEAIYDAFFLVLKEIGLFSRYDAIQSKL